MAETYKKLTYDNKKIQVESAIRDGNGAVISTNYSKTGHTHAISDVTSLQTTLNGKAASNHTHNYAGSSSAGGAATTALACTGNSATATLATRAKGLIYIVGTGTVAGTWLGSSDDITAYYDGLSISYYINIAGASTTTLNINNLGAKTVRRNNAKLTTHLPVGTVVILTYTTIDNVGYWVWADYDSNSNTRNTAGSTDTNSKIFLIGATSQAANPQTYSHDTVYVGTDGHVYSNSKQVVNLSDTQALTNKTYNGYTLKAACGYEVETTLANDAKLPTGAAVKTFVEGKGYTTNTGTVTQVKVGTTEYNPSSGVVSLPAYPDISGKIDTAGTGLSKSGTTLNHSNSVTANTTGVGSATAVPIIKYDAQGHITSVSTATIYPPTTAGTSGQLWKSDGSGQGGWVNQSTLITGIHSTSVSSYDATNMNSAKTFGRVTTTSSDVSGYPNEYRLSVSGATTAHYPSVTFRMDELNKNIWAPICSVKTDGFLTIYSKKDLDTSVNVYCTFLLN